MLQNMILSSLLTLLKINLSYFGTFLLNILSRLLKIEDLLLTSLALVKCKKKCNILYVILVQDFCQLKIKIAQFAGGFRVI